MADDPPLDPIEALKAIRTFIEMASDDAAGTRLEPIFREIRNVLDNALPPRRRRRTGKPGIPMAKTKQDDEVEAMTASHRLPARHAFAVGERVKGPGIVGEVVTQDGPWTVTVQQERGGRITVGTELLARA